jgi:hypothetical protein
METPVTVQPQVGLIKGHSIGWPRSETETTIMTIGRARPQEDAARLARRELVRWRDQEAGLGAEEAPVLPIMAGKARLGKVADPKRPIGTGIAENTAGCDDGAPRQAGLALARLACAGQSAPKLKKTRQTLQGVYHARWQQHDVTPQHRGVGIHQQCA